MDLFLYGWLSHANAKKARIMRDLKETPCFPILRADFARIVHALIHTVAAMGDENDRILAIGENSLGETTVRP